jgi:hypothetical protein
MKKMLLIPLFIFICSCQKIQPLESKPTDVSVFSNEFKLTDLHKTRVDELFVVLFKDQLSQDQWTTIFQDTQKLSSNKRLLIMIEGLSDETSEKLRDQIITENATLLQRLSDSSLYLLNWSFGDENCRFLFKEALDLICKPRTLDNPLNGGLPQQRGAIEILTPNPITEDIKVKYLNVVLYKSAPQLNIQLRLRLENFTENQFWFKGDVKINQHSFNETPFGYGYSEMSLSK